MHMLFYINFFNLIFRQAALKAALNAPAVKEKEKTSRLQKKEIYPHVYDSLSKAKQTAGTF